MTPGNYSVGFAIKHPKIVAVVIIAVSLFLGLWAAVPSIWPDRFPALNSLAVDTDPENMLAADEPVRVFHDRMKKEMALYDMVVVGVLNNNNPQGVFNPVSLQKVYELTEFAKTLRWPDPDNPGYMEGVIEADILAPSTVDNMEQDSPGSVRFEWLMPRPPQTDREALAVRAKAARLSLLNGTLVSADGQALCIYLPLTSKDLSFRVYEKLKEKIAGFSGDEEYHITGLPVAEDTFGVEMFIQMGISAPLAMLIIFLVMLFFFRKFVLILSPLIIAMLSTICTMGLLIITGNTVHIMSSMIPIFIMPIAVLDAVHILSEFFDRYQQHRDRRRTILAVMDHLFLPMLYTSITTAVGFASLALAPIPPVQVFGIFVAFGVLIAWVFTIIFIPAYIMFIPESSLKSFGLTKKIGGASRGTLLSALGKFTCGYPKLIVTVALIVLLSAVYGMTLININDNPIKWFNKKHPIREADRVLNAHFGGTYMAYLELEPQPAQGSIHEYAEKLNRRFFTESNELADMVDGAQEVFSAAAGQAAHLSLNAENTEEIIAGLSVYADIQKEKAPLEQQEAWDATLLFIDRERQRFETFKQPEMLSYIDGLQKFLLSTATVGKSSSLADIVKTVYRELVSGEDKDFIIPKSAAAVGQCLITYQNSHRPHDIWHFVTPDYKKSVLWIQLTSGDNQDMLKIIAEVDEYVRNNPPPLPIKHKWFGLTYINTVWQDKMVKGMLEAFMGSFLIVFLMMTFLYRSALWGLLSMIPLSITIALIYGVTGFIEKDYDMPIAVLSSLSLGLAVDYAIHFLSRTRSLYAEKGSWNQIVGPLFGEPARAIARNVAVLGVGFLPLLFAPLVPYRTVGVFIASILMIAGVATLFILPALITLLEKLLFPQTAALAFTCKCGTCIASAIAIVALALINLAQFTRFGWTQLSWISAGSIFVLVTSCFLMSRRQSCSINGSKKS